MKKAGGVILNILKLRNHVHTPGSSLASLDAIPGIRAVTLAQQKEQLANLLAKDPTKDTEGLEGDEAMLTRAGAAFGVRKYTAQDDHVFIKGMTTPLKLFQFAGAGWMVRLEKDKKISSGGILADSMGLGKTVQALALVKGHPPTKEDIKNKEHLTLIIAPSNAVGQWEEEVYKHCSEDIRVFKYKQSDRTKRQFLMGQEIL